MNEPDWADRFNCDVDSLLNQAGRTDSEPAPTEYRQALDLAHTLATTDFSAESRVQDALRRRLLGKMETRIAAQQRPRLWPRLSLAAPKRAVGVLVALVTLAMLTLLTPTGRSLAQTVERFIREFRWPNTVVRQTEPDYRPENLPELQEDLKRELAAGRAWHFSFEEHNFGGCCADGMRNEVISLPQAVAEAGYELRLPTFLPDGFVLDEVRLLDRPPYSVFITYQGPAGRLGLFQSFVGFRSEQRVGDTIIVNQRANAIITDGTIEKRRVGTVQATLLEGELLVWEEDGVSFSLIGPGLDAETLVQIAESLSPVH
jgi:hypothetical protein